MNRCSDTNTIRTGITRGTGQSSLPHHKEKEPTFQSSHAASLSLTMSQFVVVFHLSLSPSLSHTHTQCCCFYWFYFPGQFDHSISHKEIKQRLCPVWHQIKLVISIQKAWCGDTISNKKVDSCIEMLHQWTGGETSWFLLGSFSFHVTPHPPSFWHHKI